MPLRQPWHDTVFLSLAYLMSLYAYSNLEVKWVGQPWQWRDVTLQ